MGLNVSLLRESFLAIAPHAEEVVDYFYRELFTRYPAAEGLFVKVDMAKQKKALANSLGHIVEFVEDTPHLTDYLRKMGARHLKYGVENEHFQWVGESLLATFAYFFDSDWSAELNETWTAAYQVISEEMLRGMESEKVRVSSQSQIASEKEKRPPAVDVVVKELASELFKKAIQDTCRSEVIIEQVRAKVEDLVQVAIAEEASKILAKFKNTQSAA